MEDRAKGALDLIWGAEKIGQTCGLNRRQTFYMLETKKLPAKKVGSKWVAERGKLREFFLRSADE